MTEDKMLKLLLTYFFFKLLNNETVITEKKIYTVYMLKNKYNIESG